MHSNFIFSNRCSIYEYRFLIKCRASSRLISRVSVLSWLDLDDVSVLLKVPGYVFCFVFFVSTTSNTACTMEHGVLIFILVFVTHVHTTYTHILKRSAYRSKNPRPGSARRRFTYRLIYINSYKNF